MKITVCGSCGRMGQSIIKVAQEMNHQVVLAIDKTTKNPEDLISNSDICIDFSSPTGIVDLCGLASKFKIPVVSGTTGLTEDCIEKIQEYSAEIPILLSSNFSIGIYLLRKLVREAVNNITSSWDIEIVEKHHNQKKDAPSGTAKQILSDIENITKNSKTLFGRCGNIERKTGEICVHSVRGGDVAGEHEVYFFSNGERLEISHRATNREIFARGAVLAAEKFLKFKEPKIYSLEEIFDHTNHTSK